jgi:hypothetical protein
MSAMKIANLLLAALLALPSVSYAQTPEEKARVSRVSKKMSTLMQKLGPGVNEVNMDWKANPEAQEISKYPSIKKIAAINLIIWGMQDNDKNLFPNSDKSPAQTALIVISRMIAYSQIQELISTSIDELPMRDYLQSEISDINLVMANKISLESYFSARKQREDKKTSLLMPNKEFVGAMLRMKAENSPLIEKLSNKTTGASYMSVCFQNLALCDML